MVSAFPAITMDTGLHAHRSTALDSYCSANRFTDLVPLVGGYLCAEKRDMGY